MKIYHPIRFLDVDATTTHGSGAAYRVSVGNELWADGDMHRVYKVQMVYDGQVAGRKSPSFPIGSDDMERVIDAMREIKAGKGKSGRGRIEAVGDELSLSVSEANSEMAT